MGIAPGSPRVRGFFVPIWKKMTPDVAQGAQLDVVVRSLAARFICLKWDRGGHKILYFQGLSGKMWEKFP